MAKNEVNKIRSLESLFQHLQWAMEVEHFTIPPYLCALYSIPDGKNVKAASLIRSVVMEEMLHMVLVANLMNAVGIHPVMDTSTFIPNYPQALPHSGDHFIVNLEKFSKSAMETFMKIESPEGNESNPKELKNHDHYHSIGELYTEIEKGFNFLNQEKKIFIGDKKNQISAEHYYGGGGIAMEVYDLGSALKVIAEIKEQGEGHIPKPNDPGSILDSDAKNYGQEPELAHYYRFMEIAEEKSFAPKDTPKTGPRGNHLQVNWDDVYQMLENPKVSNFEHEVEIRDAMNDFNECYTLLLAKLQFAFSGNPSSLTSAVTEMYKLKYKAVALMKTPTGKGNTTVGPSFEYYRKV